VHAWNVGLQHKLASKLIFDIAYIGSSSKDLLSHAELNPVPLGATFLPQYQHPPVRSSLTRSADLNPSRSCGPLPPRPRHASS
jgi:hypothetical protein